MEIKILITYHLALLWIRHSKIQHHLLKQVGQEHFYCQVNQVNQVNQGIGTLDIDLMSRLVMQFFQV